MNSFEWNVLLFLGILVCLAIYNHIRIYNIRCDVECSHDMFHQIIESMNETYEEECEEAEEEKKASPAEIDAWDNEGGATP